MSSVPSTTFSPSSGRVVLTLAISIGCFIASFFFINVDQNWSILGTSWDALVLYAISVGFLTFLLLPASDGRIFMSFRKSASCFASCFLFVGAAQLLPEPTRASAIYLAHLVALAFLVLLLLPIAFFLSLNVVLDFGTSYEPAIDGLTIRRFFSTRLISWDHLQIFAAYAGCRRTNLFWNFGTILLGDMVTKERKILWPYLIPRCDTLIAVIEHNLILNVVPRLLNRHHRSGTLHFGKVSLVRREMIIEYVRGKSKTIPLDSVLLIKESGNALLIIVRNDPGRSVYVPLKCVSNVRVFCRLLQMLGVRVVEQQPLVSLP